MVIRRLLLRYLALFVVICCSVSCLTGCGANETDQNPQHSEETPAANAETAENESSQEAVTTEEEKINTLYHECAKLTYCIFTI